MSVPITTAPEKRKQAAPPVQPRISYRALGISNVFFGLLAAVGALANWSSGKGADRATLSAILALTLIVMGILMIQNNPLRRQ